jgi:hypothetical protein
MPNLIREPIGLRVIVRALRPDDQEPFWLWRADPEPEMAEFLARGEREDRARLWASLLRWREAEAIVNELQRSGWRCTLHGVRAIALGRAVGALQPPAEDEGWTLIVAGIELRAVHESPGEDDESLARLLRFLNT